QRGTPPQRLRAAPRPGPRQARRGGRGGGRVPAADRPRADEPEVPRQRRGGDAVAQAGGAGPALRRGGPRRRPAAERPRLRALPSGVGRRGQEAGRIKGERGLTPPARQTTTQKSFPSTSPPSGVSAAFHVTCEIFTLIKRTLPSAMPTKMRLSR